MAGNGNAYDLMLAVKSIIQIYIMFHHFGGLLYRTDKLKHLQVSETLAIIAVTFSWLLFCWVYFASGAHAAKWLFAQLNKNKDKQSLIKLTMHFYYKKACEWLPTSYLVTFSYMFYINYLIDDKYQDRFAQDICWRGLANNLFFVSNLWSTENMVIQIVEFNWLNFIIHSVSRGTGPYLFLFN